jgi:hypothetical protein
MPDAELRGLLLETYYRRRKERLIGLMPADFDGKVDQHEIQSIAGQLADHGLIHWRAHPGQSGVGGGMGTITAAGVDVVEGRAPAPLAMQLRQDRGRSSTASFSTMPAPDRCPSVTVAIEQLLRAIEDSAASAADKGAATVLLHAFRQHPLVRTMASGNADHTDDGESTDQSATPG